MKGSAILKLIVHRLEITSLATKWRLPQPIKRLINKIIKIVPNGPFTDVNPAKGNKICPCCRQIIPEDANEAQGRAKLPIGQVGVVQRQ